MANRDINRLKVILANKKNIQEKLDKNPDYIKSNTCRIFKKGSLWKQKTFTFDYTLGIAFIEYMIIYYSV